MRKTIVILGVLLGLLSIAQPSEARRYRYHSSHSRPISRIVLLQRLPDVPAAQINGQHFDIAYCYTLKEKIFIIRGIDSPRYCAKIGNDKATNIPIAQLIKVAEETGVGLDWYDGKQHILPKDERKIFFSYIGFVLLIIIIICRFICKRPTRIKKPPH